MKSDIAYDIFYFEKQFFKFNKRKLKSNSKMNRFAFCNLDSGKIKVFIFTLNWIFYYRFQWPILENILLYFYDVIRLLVVSFVFLNRKQCDQIWLF